MDAGSADAIRTAGDTTTGSVEIRYSAVGKAVSIRPPSGDMGGVPVHPTPAAP